MSCAPTVGEIPVLNLVIPWRAGRISTSTYRNIPTVKRAISAITKANPGKVTAPAHGFVTGDKIYVSKLKGMGQADNRAYTITALDADNFTIGIDTSAYDAYVSGGIADNGKPIDLTGHTARMEFRAKETDASAVLSLTTANGGITLGGTAGTVTFKITEAQAIALTLAQGVHELVLIDAASVSSPYFEGAFSR
jgi:hypothetical protein